MATDRHLIVNPRSGSFSEKRLAGILEMLAAAGIEPEVHRLDHSLAIESAVRQITSPGRPAVTLMVAGGDGTVNCALNGITSPDTVLAILPVGTANVLALELGLDSPVTAVERIIAGTSRPFSCGVVRNAQGERRFLLMAGIGYDAAVVRGVGSEKRLLGKGAYAVSALRELIGWDREEIGLSFSGGQFNAHTVVISNAGRYGGNFVLAPDINIFTPGVQLLAVKPPRRLALLRLLKEVLCGRLPGNDCWHLKDGTVAVSGVKPIQLDGDFYGLSPATIGICRDVARIIC